jgi:hypothetical protein
LPEGSVDKKPVAGGGMPSLLRCSFQVTQVLRRVKHGQDDSALPNQFFMLPLSIYLDLVEMKLLELSR